MSIVVIDKTSASLTLIIIAKTSVFKCWLLNNNSTNPDFNYQDKEDKEDLIKQLAANEYEISVYNKTAMINSPFFLRKKRDNHVHLNTFVSMISSDRNDQNYIKDCIDVFNAIGAENYKYSNRDRVKYAANYVNNKYSESKHQGIRFLELPKVKFSPLRVLSTLKNMNQVLYILDQLFHVLELLHTNQIAHNDMHWANIMLIDHETKSPIIKLFDYDRSYSKSLGSNAFLNKDPTEYPCNYSQCNKFSNHHSIDFYKSIIEIVTFEDSNVILHNLGLPDITFDKKKLEENWALNIGKYTSSYKLCNYLTPWLDTDGVSTFWKPNRAVQLLLLCFGPWVHIYDGFIRKTGFARVTLSHTTAARRVMVRSKSSRRSKVPENLVNQYNKFIRLKYTDIITDVKFKDVKVMMKNLGVIIKSRQKLKFNMGDGIAVHPRVQNRQQSRANISKSQIDFKTKFMVDLMRKQMDTYELTYYELYYVRAILLVYLGCTIKPNSRPMIYRSNAPLNIPDKYKQYMGYTDRYSPKRRR